MPNEQKSGEPIEGTHTVVSDAGPAGELQRLLHRRLRLLSSLCSLFFALALAFQVSAFGVRADLFWSYLLPQGLILATMGINAALLCRCERPTLRWLRRNELVCFGVSIIAFAWLQAQFLRNWLPAYAARGPLDLYILIGFWDFSWFALIVAYGVFIPNGWRRCTAVAGAIAVLPLTIGAVIGLSEEGVEGPLLGQAVFVIGIHMGLAVAFAISASHRDAAS